MSKTAWDRFKESLERGVTSRADLEALDLAALRELNDLERERARQLLAAQLDGSDPRIIDALAELDTPKAWADVEQAFSSAYGSAQIHAAMWLWLRNRDPRVLPQMRAMATGNPDAPSFLIELLLTLARIDSPDVDDILIDVLASSRHPRVVITACDRIFSRHGLDQWEHEGAPIFTLRCGLTSTFPSVRAQAVDQLRQLVARKRVGESDAQLGIVGHKLTQRSPALSQVTQLAFHPANAVPDNATLDQLQGGERAWAIDLLLGRLEQGDDRVIPALQHLGGDRIQLALADRQAGRRIC